jgi:hypothetical protein
MQDRRDHVGSSGRFAGAQVAAFTEYPFALFFSCDSVGVRMDDIASILQKPGDTISMQIPCGKLIVTKKNGLESNTFAQERSDVLTPSLPELKLQNAKNKLFSRTCPTNRTRARRVASLVNAPLKLHLLYPGHSCVRLLPPRCGP